MKLHIVALGLAAVGAIAISGVARAQNVPEQFVVSGKAAEKIHDFTTINLATAERIVDACESAVTAQGGGEHTIIVLDHNGNRVYMDRMDGQGYLNIVTAEMKARTALLGQEPSKSYMNRVIQDPTEEFQDIQLGIYPVAGALPIVVNGQLIGVVGAGGYRPNPPVWSDEICAHKALVEVIGPSVPPLLEDLPPRRNPNRGNAPVPRFVTAMPPKPSLPAEFVVGGEAATKVFDGDQISLATAKKIGRACRDWAASKGATMSLYVVDNAGEMVHMERMDGQLPNDIRTALLKAQTALKTRQPTSIGAAQLKNNPGGLLRTTALFNFFEVSGGIPIVVDGQMIGAVGVSGVEGGQDENCAIEGLKAAFGEHVTLPVYSAAAGGGAN
ncbi:MAG TPA: heme-binding protein [Candidatus Acidoferrales bacterium]|nr:heme-binding protein [Candidatus Acidoferrales bacterium]